MSFLSVDGDLTHICAIQFVICGRWECQQGLLPTCLYWDDALPLQVCSPHATLLEKVHPVLRCHLCCGILVLVGGVPQGLVGTVGVLKGLP